MAGIDPVAHGVSLALDAHRRGLLTTDGLSLILRYYDNEGARDPAPPRDVLERLGGVQFSSPTSELPAAAPEQGRPFSPRLTILETLGRGGMGVVYKGYDRVLNRVVAIKVVHEELPHDRRAVYLSRFEREAQVMARVRHPACAQVHDAGVHPSGQPYLVMEFVQGQSLASVIATSPPLPISDVIAWGTTLANGLAACHEAGIVHRDVKPANIIIDPAGSPRLVDFGVASDLHARERLTQTDAAVGTFTYMAPEQASGRPADPRTDVYALGATLFEAIAGRPPFDGTNLLALMSQIASQAPPPLRQLRSDTPTELADLLARCLSKAPEDRPQTASAMERELRSIRRRSRRPVSRRGLTVALCAGAAVILTVGGYGVLGADPAPEAAPQPRRPVADPPAPSPPSRVEPRPRVKAEQGEFTNVQDGSPLVWVPPGEFVVGGDIARGEPPAQTVRLARGYYIGKHEVSWARYRRFCAETGHALPPTSRIVIAQSVHEADLQDPVFAVTLSDARAYCAWAGGRLPTDVEWECAARGPDGRRYPWGPRGIGRGTPPIANIADESLRAIQPTGQDTVRGYGDGFPCVAPCGSFPLGASPAGCLDMVGNVAEWVESQGGSATRGGGWSWTDWGCRPAAIHPAAPDTVTGDVGFRLVVDSE